MLDRLGAADVLDLRRFEQFAGHLVAVLNSPNIADGESQGENANRLEQQQHGAHSKMNPMKYVRLSSLTIKEIERRLGPAQRRHLTAQPLPQS